MFSVGLFEQSSCEAHAYIWNMGFSLEQALIASTFNHFCLVSIPPVSLPALCGLQMADGRVDIWDGEEDNLIEIFKVFLV